MTTETTEEQTTTTTQPADKPGYKSTEFWLSAIAMLLGIVMSSGSVAEGGLASQIIGGVLAVLGTLGYTASRTQVKRAGKQ